MREKSLTVSEWRKDYMTNGNTIYRISKLLGIWFLLLQPAYAENVDVPCRNSFAIEGAKLIKAASSFIEEVFYPQRVQKSRQLLEWGEAQLGRKFTDEEIIAFRKTRSAIMSQSWRNEVLREAGFSASERRKLTKAPQLIEPRKEIKIEIPEQTNEAQQLKEQGFNSAYVRGIDEANEWIAIAKQLRTGEVGPYITHVDYFARKTLEHIEQLEKGVENPQQKRRFLRWRKYVETKQNFTYEDWLKVNWALAQISRNKKNEKLDNIERLIHAFPRKIAMPTTTGAVGIMTLNRAGTHGIHAIGLTNEAQYFVHDLNHSTFTTNYPPVWFYNNMEKLSESFSSIKKRKNIQLAYWLITHENGYPDNWFSSVRRMKRVLLACAIKTDRKELKGLIDMPSGEIIIHDTIIVTPASLKNIPHKGLVMPQLEEAIQIFTDIFVIARRRTLWR